MHIQGAVVGRLFYAHHFLAFINTPSLYLRVTVGLLRPLLDGLLLLLVLRCEWGFVCFPSPPCESIVLMCCAFTTRLGLSWIHGHNKLRYSTSCLHHAWEPASCLLTFPALPPWEWNPSPHSDLACCPPLFMLILMWLPPSQADSVN